MGRKRGDRARGRPSGPGGGVMEATPSSHLRQVERAARAGRSAMSAGSVGQGLGPRAGLGSGSESEPLCPEHGQALRWFCCSERRPVCAACAELGGRCQGHRIRPAQERAEELRVSGRGRGRQKAGVPEGGRAGGRRAGRDPAGTREPGARLTRRRGREPWLRSGTDGRTRRLRVWLPESGGPEFGSRLCLSFS